MSTRSIIIVVLAVVALVGFRGGCGDTFDWKNSGLPEALTDPNLLHAAGAPVGIAIREGNSGRHWGSHASEAHRDFHITLTSGTPGQLLAAFRREVKSKIESTGGSMNGVGISGAESDVREFDFRYSWHGNAGIVRARSFVDNNGQTAISVFCYEHRR